jgi:hypothetical protein
MQTRRFITESPLLEVFFGENPGLHQACLLLLLPLLEPTPNRTTP